MSDHKKLVGVIGLGIGLFFGTILFFSSIYVVDEAEQVVLLWLSEPLEEPVTEPGLHFKVPFFHEVRRFDKRCLAWDGEPNQIPTRGREFIKIDTTARWRIEDPLKFLQSVRDENSARARLDDILDSVVRDRVSSTDLVEIVRSSTWDASRFQSDRIATDDQERLDKEVEAGREQLQRDILAEARKATPQLGIQLVDFRIKRLNYIPSVQRQVFDRMISERQRIAEQFRSEGEGEAARIRGETARQLAEIQSVAKREAEEIRGRADAEAARIYAETFGADPEFYRFVRTLESYQRSLPAGTVMLLGSDSDYFRYLNEGSKR